MVLSTVVFTLSVVCAVPLVLVPLLSILTGVVVSTPENDWMPPAA